MFTDGRQMPWRAVLTATPDIGQDKAATALQPGCAHCRVVARCQGNFEAAIAVQQGRRAAIGLHVLATDLEVGDTCAVFRDGEVLLNLQAVCIEEVRQSFESAVLRLAGNAEQHVGRIEKVLDRQKIGIGLFAVECPGAGLAELWNLDRAAFPSSLSVSQNGDASANLIQKIEQQAISGRADAIQ